jgi:hypothetical protein
MTRRTWFCLQKRSSKPIAALEDEAVERAIVGVFEPITSQGAFVG